MPLEQSSDYTDQLRRRVVMGQFPKFSTPVEKTVENTRVYAVERCCTPIFRVFRRGERLYDAPFRPSSCVLIVKNVQSETTRRAKVLRTSVSKPPCHSS
jgi:hypothetical protein